MRKWIALLALACLLGACTPPVNPDEAEHAVPAFHLAMIEGDFAGIYQRAAPALREAQAQAEFVAGLQKIRARLGEVRGAERMTTTVDGRQATLTYTTAYANGAAREEFVIVQEEGQAPQLLRYRLLEPQIP
ncbi:MULTISPECIES: hypothetical protein [Uliginosibacterium]|jgi:hypothetical protein|uniref:DUF3887 domain-containing protein n=1 Tax=Uliginosibacterium aquaticum TaxID=2731212 RepID=A0ABX2ILS2_9RHOO|nr:MULTISPECIES: hypothetical protein [Uliginosibacterium]MDO6386576.1 hypothetical protein [Uliginosibacterium sp. 31-12]NSL55629.1 hypothetical protein [Uliginosibacterium aquaticum]